MKTRLIIIAALIAVSAGNLFAQGLAVNSDGSDPNANAMLDVVSPSTGAGKGMLVPRITAAQRTTASAALAGGLLDDSGNLRGGTAQGLLVYQTDGSQGFYYNTSATSTPSWTFIGGGGGGTMAAQDADAVAITGGAIDGTTIGATTQAAGAFSEVGVTGNLYLGETSALYLGTDAADQILSRGNGNLPGNLILGDGGAAIENTAGSEGYNNTYLGLDSGTANTTGYGNTGAGNGSLNENTTGYFNAAFGGAALYSNTTGGDNTATGVQALYKNESGSSNTAVGYSSIYDNTTGYANTAVGWNSLADNTTAQHSTAVGFNAARYQNRTADANAGNTAVGSYSLYGVSNSSTGQYNSALGSGALYSNTTGSYNTAVGNSALYENSVGVGNTALGYYAGAYQKRTADSDSYNTAVGYEALKGIHALSTGQFNTAVGALSLEDNTTGSDNVALGASAMMDNTSGSSNVALGSSALKDNDTGSYNVAVGTSALQAGDGCGGNVAIGYQALLSTTSGGSNTAVGSYAGISNSTSETQNTYIGAGADSSSPADISNATAVGYNAKVGASNRVVIGNSSVTSIGGYANWSNYSDIREKKNIADCDLGIEFIERLRPVSFQYNEQDKLHNGFIAQEVEQACDELDVEFGGLSTPENPDTGRYMLSYSEFVVPLVNAVKQQQRRIETLEAEIKALKGK